MADLGCLETIVENNTGETRYFSFLPRHGKVLAPGEQFSFLGHATEVIGGKEGDGARRLQAFENSLLLGDLLLVQSPAPVLRDTLQQDANKAIAIEGKVPVVTSVCSGSLFPDLVGHYDVRVAESVRQASSTQLFGSLGPVAQVGDVVGRIGHLPSVMNPGFGMDPLIRQFEASKDFSPLLVENTVGGQPVRYIRLDGADDFMFNNRVFVRTLTLTPPLGSGETVTFTLGNNDPIPWSPTGWTAHILFGNPSIASDTLLLGQGFPQTGGGVESRGEWQLRLNTSERLYLRTLADGITPSNSSTSAVLGGNAILASYTQNNLAGIASFFVDGVLVDSVAFSGFDTSAFDDAGGNPPPSACSFGLGFIGGLDWSVVRIYAGPMDAIQLEESAVDLGADFSLVLGDFT